MNYLDLLISTSRARFIKQAPLLINWFITSKCQSKCLYCDYWKSNDKETVTSENIINTIDIVHRMGARFIHFSGGEPLLRKDFVPILAHANKKGFYLSLNSNGLLVPQQINDFKNYIKTLKLSLDGPPSVNNYVRGVKSFDQVITSIELAKKFKIKTMISALLTTYNYKYIDYLIDLANKHSTKIFFMFADTKKLKSGANNSCSLNLKLQNELIEQLIGRIKSKQGKYIANSISGLLYLKSNQPIKCHLQQFNLIIDENGYINTGCSTKSVSDKFNIKKDNIQKAYDFFSNVAPCTRKCWCTPKIETNLLLSGNYHIFLNYLKKIFF